MQGFNKLSRWRRLAAMGIALTAISAAGLGIVMGAVADNTPTHPLKDNQTEGFGAERLLGFTYYQQFFCTHEPNDDLDHNGMPADIDPQEFQAPKCVAGQQPSIGPTGDPIGKVEPLFVIVPFFEEAPPAGSADARINICPITGNLCAALGKTTFKPEAFNPTPSVDVQCPEPGLPRTHLHGAFSTCTMHTMTVDLRPMLQSLGVNTSGVPAALPLPNHSHVIDGANFGAIWWQVIVVLVTDPSAWPNADGTHGITSVDAIRDAQAAHQAFPDAKTNFFLFFDSREFAR